MQVWNLIFSSNIVSVTQQRNLLITSEFLRDFPVTNVLHHRGNCFFLYTLGKLAELSNQIHRFDLVLHHQIDACLKHFSAIGTLGGGGGRRERRRKEGEEEEGEEEEGEEEEGEEEG